MSDSRKQKKGDKMERKKLKSKAQFFFKFVRDSIPSKCYGEASGDDRNVYGNVDALVGKNDLPTERSLFPIDRTNSRRYRVLIA